MHPLLEALSRWPGRRETKSVLETKGYWLPERWKEIILANCSECDESKIERYWDEAALEYLCAAGRVHSDRRRFGGETAYRSRYLDDLASLPENQVDDARGPLDLGLKAFTKRALAHVEPGGSIYYQIGQQLEKLKQVEIVNFKISSLEWTGTKGDFSRFLREIAEARGFHFKKKKLKKNFGEFLDFNCFIDPGMRRTWRFQLPVNFEIVHTSAPEIVFHTWDLGQLMPGFHFYRLHQSPESAVLGMRAHVDLFDTIGDLIARRL
jgi:hypothetical protein